jgi:acetyl-CoA acetyltransferase
MTLRDAACVVGVGESAYGRRGSLADSGELGLACDAIRAGCSDAGLKVSDIDGFSSYCDDRCTPSLLAPQLGITSWSYAGMAWGGGGSGLPTAVLNAVMAVVTGAANYVAVVRSNIQGAIRLGGRMGVNFRQSYTDGFGLDLPLAVYAMRTRRYLDTYRVDPESLAAVAMSQRAYASKNPRAVYQQPMSIGDYHAGRMVVSPLRIFDCCMESDGASAAIITTPDRARDLDRAPVVVAGVATKTAYRFDSSMAFTFSDTDLASAGQSSAARALFASTGLSPDDVDVAGFYDGCSASVLWALEDWGFVPPGSAGDFVRSGGNALGGRLPVNTAGGHLSEAYQQGLGQLIEGVRQLRGESVNQVPDAEVFLFGAGPGLAPMGGLLLHS